MQQILVYADSLSWGIIPDSRKRFAFRQRWPGVMELELEKLGHEVRVIEDCLNGRRTVWEDPFKPGRNGLSGLEQRIEIHSPLSLVILFLGTNDFQSVHQYNAWHSAQGIAALIAAIRRAPVEPGMPVPEILVVAPPDIRPKDSMLEKFSRADEKSAGLAETFENAARQQNCRFFNAAFVTESSKVDGVHLDEDQHAALGKALASTVGEMINA
ncbi:MAG: SGNH/GDSL hydrolase family protein [Gammaproteobacteria bacterium]